MQRRTFLNRAAVAGVGVLTGVAVSQGAEGAWASSGSPRHWAQSVRPDLARGSARLWWSADPAVGRRVAVTFDDGPTEQFTAQVLGLLAAARVTATFFVVGELVRRHGDLLRRARDGGHEIGNHSQDHVSSAVSDPQSVHDSVLRCSDTIEQLTGRRPRWFRPPRGEITTATLLAARAAQVDIAMWSLGRGDAPDGDAEGIRRHLVQAVHPGAVVDLHDGIGRSSWVGLPDAQLITRRRAEITALPQVLARWQDDGYTFATLSDLIPAAPGSLPRSLPGSLPGSPPGSLPGSR